MYLTPTQNHWACDIEADDLLPGVTTIWCVTLTNLVTKEEVEFTDAESFKVWLEERSDIVFVGHNFLAYDCVVLNRLWGCRIRADRVVDTFVLSQLYNPTYPKPRGMKGTAGAHSLEAWGIRLRYPKGEFNDFSQYTPQMLTYCRRDTRLTALLFLRLSERMRNVGFTERGVELEHLAWNIIQNKQKRAGFPFDIKRAQELYVTLRAREKELQDEIYALWPPRLEVVGEYKSGRKRDGTTNLQYERHKGQYPVLEWKEDGGYIVYDYVAFNLGSPPQRVAKLLELGWQPTQYTKAGNPKVDEDALLDFAERSQTPEVKALAKWVVINSRANMVNTWLEAYNRDTGCIHGSLFIASTLRYRHSNPNSANIPAVRLKKGDNGDDVIQYGEAGGYSYESRDLWVAGGSGRDGDSEWVLVGIDGTGIQNRCLIHGLIKTIGEEPLKDFIELSLRGDIHKHNIDVLGLAHKAAAKKFYYTLMMGGGGEKLANDQVQFGTHMTAGEATAKKNRLIASMPGFGELIKALKAELEETGRIRLCDGTPILVPSPHMVIPYLLQGDESRLMKQAMIYVDEIIRREKWGNDIIKVADIHDEWQYRARKSVVDEFVAKALPCFPRAGESFDYRIIIEGDAKIGQTWAETH
jgi:DNA polymerase-1